MIITAKDSVIGAIMRLNLNLLVDIDRVGFSTKKYVTDARIKEITNTATLSFGEYSPRKAIL
ncbi:hypothetical protein KUL150_01220 [Alteromonas sp. KUL150]|nr:hypothetical protein KUL150_01220 [Alteromonas sp. KUL150]